MPQKKSHYHHLKKKWTQKHAELQEKVFTKHPEAVRHLTDRSKQLAIGSLGSLMLLTTPALPAITNEPQAPKEQDPLKNIPELDENVFLVSDLASIVPTEVRPLNSDEEKVVEQTLSRYFNIPVRAEIDGKRLNTTYGIIGAEQHLMRYPGDTMESHFDNAEDSQKYYSSGMAPGRGAWGYFAPSQAELTQKEIDQEKYYLAVQTFLSKDFNSRVGEYRDFYKHRKMLIVNPQNGKAMVVVVGDAGPAQWTGKHLGGSPEVMKYLERVDGRARGSVLYFFVDDPEDKIPLGPIEPGHGHTLT